MTKRTVLGCLVALIAAIGLLASLYWRLLGSGIARHEARIAAKLAPVRAAIANGAKPDTALVARLSADPDVRNTLYDELREKGMHAVFPAEYRTFEAHAESELVYWLCHPNELQQPPDQIELMKVVAMNSGTPLGEVDYYLFRFRTNPPHWAADAGWMAGVAGPYVKGRPLDGQSVDATFSEFESYDSMTPEQHVQYYHEMAASHGVYEELAAQSD
jgi:hypothetical protein